MQCNAPSLINPSTYCYRNDSSQAVLLQLNMIWSRCFLLAVAFFVRLGAAQESGWQSDQVNATMCYWQSPRAAVVRNTLYIDGGYLWWLPGMSNGAYGDPTSDGNPLGIVYLLNFSTPFSTSENISNIFTTMSKASNGGSVNNIGPQYYDGAMFANDYEWFTYGGLLDVTDAYTPPPADAAATYQVYASGPAKQFFPGFAIADLPNGITRYVTDGAAVSVPSENKGYYFGGLRAADYGPIYYLPGPANESMNADVESTTLITLDMTIQDQETWTNESLPSSVPGRANAELVWVPVSKEGILVAIGGVINPSYANINQTDSVTDADASKQISPTFMSTVAVYDISDKVWYEQPTSGAPGALTQGCTVLASADDGSSHNIYWYGGFDGLHPTQTFSDDVWILSIPSFIWMKVYSGNETHGRAGHKCTKPYPDQMFVIGGYSSLSGLVPTCVEGGIIQIFNLSSTEWLSSYDPRVWSNYTVPTKIYQVIGGKGTGSATQDAPSPTGFADTTLTSLFAASYNTSKITTYYPYTPIQTNPTNRTTLLPTPIASSSGNTKLIAPVLGVVLGLAFITVLVLGIILYRRRKLLKRNGLTGESENGTMDSRYRIMSWVRGTRADAKAPTVTTEETPMSPYEEEERMDMQEVGGTQVHEMMDTSLPVELSSAPQKHQETGLTHMPINIHTRNGLASSPSAASRSSTVSRVSHTSATRPHISPVHTPRADSPSLGSDASGAARNLERGGRRISGHGMRMGSDVSQVSEGDRGHLRQISESSVSTDGAFVTPMETSGVQRASASRGGNGGNIGVGGLNVVSPLTPPLGMGTSETSGYLGAGSPSSIGREKRKSNFAEELDDTDEGK